MDYYERIKTINNIKTKNYTEDELTAEHLIEALQTLLPKERWKFQDYLKQAFVWDNKEI